jgi:hypothetical protein
MEENKRIVFSNECPNDQGGIIPNNAIDFSRYALNPVVLRNHIWEERSVAMMTDIQFDGKNWTGVPEFHKITEESKIDAAMYEKGFLRSASIGGNCIWMTTGKVFKDVKTGKDVPEYYVNEQGLKVAEKFILYEISLPTLPSNPEAVTTEHLSAKIYEDSEIENVNQSIVTLNS